MYDPPPARRTRPRVAITLGDPRGIGPEVAAKALALRELSDEADFVVIGPEASMPPAAEGIETFAIASWHPTAEVSAAGRVAGEAIRIAVEFALRGDVDAVVTAPIDKAAFRAGGWHYPGHTEMLQKLCGVPAVGMMMAAETTLLGGGLRVVLATTHMALHEVFNALTPEMLVEQARLTDTALRDWWQIKQPRIVLCALNPHAGDGGLFGDEEARVIAPAVARLRSAGFFVDGPIPADTVFTRALRGEWDAVIAPYHDVGMAAFKTAAFGHGVNVTLGLPFPRTSPDHGTAIDIAGRGVADPASMIEAIRLALRLARSFDTKRLFH
ncbi:4-hydroxythreonine-4-phosphate dehydrogenase PdxA [soil metagenome]